MSFSLNYDELIQLDAEDLAETGVAEAYELLLPKLRKYVQQPASIEEAIDNDTPRYSVKCRAKEFAIYGPELREDNASNSWGRATHAFFAIINDQLTNSEYRFYAINGGNDLGGMFLTPAQAEAARPTLPRKLDWPYLPTDEEPWHGQHHH
jgi:hypothetical protein